MKRTILYLPFIVILSLFATACGVISAPTPVSETTVPRPTATSIPQSEPFPTAVKPDSLNVPYVPEGNSLQRLDVYLPANGDGPFPTILVIHGGGFRARSKILYSRLAGHLTELGYAVVSINYRLAVCRRGSFGSS